MTPNRIAAAALAALVSAVVAFPAFSQDAMTADPASMSVEELVEARKARMKENGATMRAAGSLSGAEAVAAAESLMASFESLPALFPEGSITDDSRALPVIWERWDEFEALFDEAHEAVSTMRVAAEAGDAAGYASAVKAVGATCGECHQTFRAEKD